MSMSDDEPYDADGDVGRFLHCPSPEAHMLPCLLSEPEGTLVGLGQHAPAAITTDDEVQAAGHQQAPQTLNAAAPELLGHQQQVPTRTEFQGLPAPPQTMNAAPAFGGLQQAPPITGFQGHPAAPQTLLGVAQEFGLQQQQAPITDFQGHYPPLQTLHAAPDFGLPAEPAIDAAAEHYRQEAAIMDVDYDYPPRAMDNNIQAPMAMDNIHQAPTMAMDNIQAPMAMDNIQAPTQTMLAAPDHEMQHHHHAHAGGGFPDPTPMHCDGGVDEASLHMLANGGGVIPDPSPCSLYQQLINDGEVELAAIIRDIERGDNAGAAAADGGGGSAGGAALNDEVYPVKENVYFRPIIRGQLDCSRCRSVREVVCLDERRKMHLMVHALDSDPGMIFQHAIVDRMSVGPDGHLRTDVLLHHDLRGRNPEWVHNFIARSVEMMKRNRGQMQDTSCSSSLAVGTTNVVTAPPPPSYHTRMAGLQVTLNNILLSSASTATTTTVTQEQGNTTHAPVLPEAAAAAAAPETAAQPAVVAPPEQQTTDAPDEIMETAVPEAAEPQEQESADGPGAAEVAAAPEEADAQPVVVTAPAPQEQENTEAPAAAGAEAAAAAAAAAPQTVIQPPAGAVSQKEENKDASGAGAVFAPFNWEGFQPEYILESSQVPPYDPESGTNVLLYPSLIEQLRQTELARKESKRLSKMPALDTASYLEMSDEDCANEPKLGSLASFRRLCQRDGTYRLYSRRVNGINRKITKLQQTAARTGPRGLFGIKQRMETYKREKADLLDMINKAIEENERGGNNNGAGPSNRPGPSNTAAASAAPPSNESEAAAAASNDAAAAGAGPSNTAVPSSDGAGTSSDDAGPSNDAAIPSSDDGAGLSNDEAASDPASNTAIVPSSDCAGPSGRK